MNKFLKALRQYRKRQKLAWNYVAGVMEFHRSGQIHFHLVFYGHWVAPLDVIHKYWPYAEYNGIEVRRHTGLNVARYLGRYVGKFKKEIDNADPEDFVKWVWYFGTRLYNTRHRRTNKNGNQTFGLPGEAVVADTEWICVGEWVSETETLVFKRYKDVYGHLMGDSVCVT